MVWGCCISDRNNNVGVWMIDKPIFDFVSKGWGIKLNTPDDPTLGLYLANGPSNKVVTEEENCNQITRLIYTGPPGVASAFYYGMTFMLAGSGWNVAKLDEWIEVSPVFQEYYQRTLATKKQLEGQIKEGLTSAAKAVADYELVQHDLRKYSEIMRYFSEKDEHAIKAMFIDQVDVNTGAMSLIQMAKRWPTIIADFYRLSDDEDAIDKITKKLKDVSHAEAVVLTTKNKLYKNWKDDFREVVIGRYETLKGLSSSRKFSIDEYRTWLKPYISRYKMTKLGSETRGGRSGVFKSFVDIAGTSTFSNGITLAVWKPLKPANVERKEYIRESGKAGGDFIIHPYDAWIRKHMILDAKKGLAKEYSWLANPRKYCHGCEKYYIPEHIECGGGAGCGRIEDRTVADEIVYSEIIPDWKAKKNFLDPLELYYTYIVISVLRGGSKLPIGEIETITFDIYTYAISQNVMLVKLLELKCREREFERYIDEILGVRSGMDNVSDIVRKDFPDLFKKEEKENEIKKIIMDIKKMTDDFTNIFSHQRVPSTPGKFMFIKPGPYETDFKDRVTKYYLNVSNKDFDTIRDFLKGKMGVA